MHSDVATLRPPPTPQNANLGFASEVGMNNSDTLGGAVTATKLLITRGLISTSLFVVIFYCLRDKIC